MLAAFGLLGYESFLSWGSNYTIMADANIYSGFSAMIMVFMKLVTCKGTKRIEIVACLIAICGCVVTSEDPSASKTDTSTMNLSLGNFLCFISSLFATLYILKAAVVAKHMDLIHYLILLSFFVSLQYLAFPIIMPNTFTYSYDSETGIFGWLSNHNFIYCMVVIGFLNGLGALTL